MIRPGGSQLETVKHVKAIDHSSDMVQIAIEKNQEAVSEGRVEIVQGNAESLPWGDNSFTCATAANVFFFIEKPDNSGLRLWYRFLHFPYRRSKDFGT